MPKKKIDRGNLSAFLNNEVSNVPIVGSDKRQGIVQEKKKVQLPTQYQYWMSMESLVLPSNRCKKFQLSDNDILQFDASTIERDLPTAPYTSEIDAIRLKRGLDKKLHHTIVRDVELLELNANSQCQIEMKNSWSDCYSTLQDNLNRKGRLTCEVDLTSIKDDLSLESGIKQSLDMGNLSPRSVALKESILRGLIPLQIRDFCKYSLRNNNNNEQLVSLNLKDKQLGDAKALCLSEALRLCSHIESLDISGNRLTDISMKPLLQSIFSFYTCTSINLSNNKLDSKSIDLLKAYLQQDECCLKTLVLNKSDIDDEECGDMMIALDNNRSLRVLDLSHNLIGEMEEYNAVFPDFITGGEAIAQVLRSNNNLLELDLSWNNIRKDTAMALVKSLSVNNNLRVLKMSHNNIADTAAQHLANSLRTNITLTHLDVSYNNILPKGILVFAHALESNEAMRILNLNGNSIGNSGGKALVKAMRHAAGRKIVLVIHFKDCNMHYFDTALFDRTRPSGNYDLNLEDPYHFMIASSLCEIANAKPKASFVDFKIQKPNSKIWEKLKFIRQAMQTDTAHWDSYLQDITASIDKAAPLAASEDISDFGRDAEEKARVREAAVAKHKQAVAASVAKLAVALGLQLSGHVAAVIADTLIKKPVPRRKRIHMIFRTVFKSVFTVLDKDHSMTIDEEELAVCLQLLGLSKSNENTDFYRLYARRMIAAVDVDGNRTLNEVEFSRMMFVNMTNCSAEVPGPLLVSSTNLPWLVPCEGRVTTSFLCDVLPPSGADVQSNATVTLLVEALTQSGLISAGHQDADSRAGLQLSVCDDFFLTCEQAELLMEKFRSNQDSTMSAVELMLPQLVSTAEACKFLAQNLSFEEIMILRKKLGSGFRAITGNACGHYALDFSNSGDRQIARRLSELNNLDKCKAIVEHPTRDTSQEGDWENFRNESMNGKYIRMSSLWMQTAPSAGKLRFDFVTTSRPVLGIQPARVEAMNLLLVRLFPEEFQPVSSVEILSVKTVPQGTPAKKNGTGQLASGRAMKRSMSIVAETARQGQLADVVKSTSTKKIGSSVRPSTATTRVANPYTAFGNDCLKVKKAKSADDARGEVEYSYWADIIDTSYESYRQSHMDFLNGKLKEVMAMLENGQTVPAPGAAQDKKIPGSAAASDDQDSEVDETVSAHNSALNYKHYKDARELPMHKTEINRKKLDSLKSTSRFGSAGERKTALIQKCMKFEQQLQNLEVWLCYNLWLTVNQVEELVQRFQSYGAPDEVLCRCVCLVFNRIVDLENFGRFLERIATKTKLEVIHRLGILNVWCPMCPDGKYEFDMAAVDQREAAKILIRLAVVEPGKNFAEEEYTRSLIEPPRPGWELPMSWTQSAPGPDKIGTFSFTYSSDPAIGCSPTWAARKELTLFRCLAGTRGTFISSSHTATVHNIGGAGHHRTMQQLRAASSSLPSSPSYSNENINGLSQTHGFLRAESSSSTDSILDSEDNNVLYEMDDSDDECEGAAGLFVQDNFSRQQTYSCAAENFVRAAGKL